MKLLNISKNSHFLKFLLINICTWDEEDLLYSQVRVIEMDSTYSSVGNYTLHINKIILII